MRIYKTLDEAVPTPVYEPFKELVNTIINNSSLNATQLAELNIQLQCLAHALSHSPSTETMIDAIDRFALRATQIAEGKFRGAFATALAISLTALATAVIVAATFAAGFALGFAAGLWSGPGSFFTGVLTGAAAASVTFDACAAFAAGASAVVGTALVYKKEKIHHFFSAPPKALTTLQAPLEQFTTVAKGAYDAENTGNSANWTGSSFSA
ncbi:MAG: hypothetical protein WC785_05535 [Tatlockia sp.]